MRDVAEKLLMLVAGAALGVVGLVLLRPLPPPPPPPPATWIMAVKPPRLWHVETRPGGPHRLYSTNRRYQYTLVPDPAMDGDTAWAGAELLDMALGWERSPR